MGLQWVRLDCAFPRNPKLLALLRLKDGHKSALVYVCMLAYSGEQGTDGFIPREALQFVHGSNADVTRLVTQNLLYPQPGGWEINGWSEFQGSNEETQLRRKRAQQAAEKRWDGHQAMTNAERQKLYRARHSNGASGNAT